MKTHLYPQGLNNRLRYTFHSSRAQCITVADLEKLQSLRAERTDLRLEAKVKFDDATVAEVNDALVEAVFDELVERAALNTKGKHKGTVKVKDLNLDAIYQKTMIRLTSGKAKQSLVATKNNPSDFVGAIYNILNNSFCQVSGILIDITPKQSEVQDKRYGVSRGFFQQRARQGDN